MTLRMATPAQRSSGDGTTGTRARSAISNALCATGEFAEGRAVDDDVVVIGDELLHLAVQLGICFTKPGDARRKGGFIGCRGRPTGRRSLFGVSIDHKHLKPATTEGAGQHHRDGALAGAAFLVHNSDDFCLWHMIRIIIII